jgi:hypothetical protein
MTKQGFLEQAFELVSEKLNTQIIIAESGGLIELVEPGIFFFLKNNKYPVEKKHYMKYKPVLVNNDGQTFDYEIENLVLENGYITQKKELHGNL